MSFRILTWFSILGIYGVFETRVTESNEGFYHETAFIMMNDIEILMYVVGASFPGTVSRRILSPLLADD